MNEFIGIVCPVVACLIAAVLVVPFFSALIERYWHWAEGITRGWK